MENPRYPGPSLLLLQLPLSGFDSRNPSEVAIPWVCESLFRVPVGGLHYIGMRVAGLLYEGLGERGWFTVHVHVRDGRGVQVLPAGIRARVHLLEQTCTRRTKPKCRQREKTV